jgi:hypothetical protein
LVALSVKVAEIGVMIDAASISSMSTDVLLVIVVELPVRVPVTVSPVPV